MVATASCAVAPAMAEPCVVDALGRVATNFPPGCTPTLDAPAPATTPSTSTGSGGLSGFVSEHAGWIVLGVIALIAFAVVKGLRAQADEEKKATAEEQQAALARGRAIAQDHHAAQVQAAHDAVASVRPDPRDYDPDGIGLAPPPMQAPDVPDAPPQSPADLRRYATFGAVVPWRPGTAFSQVVSSDGDISGADAAWIEACRAARLGDFDTETGAFTPAAELTNVRNFTDDSGDVQLAVLPRDIFVSESQLDGVRKFLVKTARVASASPFEREFETGKYLTRLSNTATPQQVASTPQQAAPAAQTSPYNDDDDWI